MKNIFFLFVFGFFYCRIVFSQSDTTAKKSFGFGLKLDGTIEPYRKGNDEGLRIYQGLEMAEGLFSLDPAIVVSRNRSSLCIGPKFIFENSDSYARGGEWKGVRLNYQYTFISQAHKCNLFLFYEIAYVWHKQERQECPCYDGNWFPTFVVSQSELINQEVGVGGRWKWAKDFYFNFSYGIGYQFIKWSWTETNMDNNVELSHWSGGSLTHISRFTGFLRVGLQYDFHL